MRALGITLAIAIALALQTSIARFVTPGAGLIDLVFVAVVYIALSGGPAAGLIAGAVAGLAQDALAATGSVTIAIGAGTVATRSIIGIGGLAKTVVGFFAGIIGSQFIVARPLPRALVFFTATVAHAIMFVGLYRVIDRGIRADAVRRRSSARPAPTRWSACWCFRWPICCRASSIVGGRWADTCGSTAGWTKIGGCSAEGLGIGD